MKRSREDPLTITLPFGHRWHLEVSADTYLLLERGTLPPAARTLQTQHSGSSASDRPVIEIDLLALGQGWDTGLLVDFADAQQLLEALQGNGLVRTPGWVAEPGWLTLNAQPVGCQLELTPPIRAALIKRLFKVLAHP